MKNDDYVLISRSALEEALERASEQGATKALRMVGLHDESATQDIRDLRNLLDGFRVAKTAAIKTIATWVTGGFLAIIMASIAARAWING
ncbi:DUF6127 family protein [Falsiroseomonas sp. CW058]|uniref:DUF6127 family protein n=1 Tax=Falsiroseomonas sp. CW058 TaxID=3388664 RepID=UPI003D31E43A